MNKCGSRKNTYAMSAAASILSQALVAEQDGKETPPNSTLAEPQYLKQSSPDFSTCPPRRYP
jgi:hypothetical protein